MKPFIFLLSMIILQSLSAQDALNCATELLKAVKQEQAYQQIVEDLAKMEVKDLASQLDTDEKRKAFWINIYNANIQIILGENPELFEDRRSFFSTERVTIAGKKLSFEDIEHGIIRRSQNKLTLGLFPKLFIDDFEKKMRVEKRDGRIHFALNCGAKSCPPVAIYEAARIEEQLDAMAKYFLAAYSRYDTETNTVHTTTLFSWFRGDFGGLSGVKQYLKRYEIIPEDSNPNLAFDEYDWTLLLDNWSTDD